MKKNETEKGKEKREQKEKRERKEVIGVTHYSRESKFQGEREGSRRRSSLQRPEESLRL